VDCFFADVFLLFFGRGGDGGTMLSLQINITRERVSLDYPELDQAINDDNFTKAFYTYYCLSECSQVKIVEWFE
jgi:hypothetical protein